MTFGTKLKQARQNAKLSQEQLAEKLCVSRSAVAKWETDKGMPDIDNLMAIAKALDVSLDYLLSDDEELTMQTIKEPIDFISYQKAGKRKSKYDAVVMDKFPNATAITPLLRQKKVSVWQNIFEWVTGMFGSFNVVDQLENKDQYYLVDVDEKQYWVVVSKEFITTSQLVNKITDNKFTVGDNKFRKVMYSIMD